MMLRLTANATGRTFLMNSLHIVSALQDENVLQITTVDGDLYRVNETMNQVMKMIEGPNWLVGEQAR